MKKVESLLYLAFTALSIFVVSCSASCDGDPNAEKGCGLHCDNQCKNYLTGITSPCPRIACPRNGCECKDGHVYDLNIKKCVKPDNCSPICGDNETYTPCVGASCGMKNCSQLGGPQVCIDTFKCDQGCVCKDGYLRLQNGTCVSIDQCPTPKCKKNERFSLCPAKECQPQSCEEMDLPIDCPDANDECPGVPACICDYGYLRNKQGICRPRSECAKCTGPHEYFACGPVCDNACRKLDGTRNSCQNTNIKCVHRCYCKYGYARNENDICIPKYKCPEPTTIYT